MKAKEKNTLLKKFYEGNSSTKEEKQLFQAIGTEEQATHSILSFFEKQRNNYAYSTRNKALSIINKKIKQTKKRWLYSVSVAASIAIVVIVLNFKKNEKTEIHPSLLAACAEEQIIYQDNDLRIYFK